MTDPAVEVVLDFGRRTLTTAQILERAHRDHENRIRWGLVKPVVCELCQKDDHRQCVKPCTCDHGRVRPMTACVPMGCSCPGHYTVGVHHMVACCDQPHLRDPADDEFIRQMFPNLSEGGDEVGLTKHGAGEVLREPDDNAKTASQNWTEDDAKALAKENDDSDDKE